MKYYHSIGLHLILFPNIMAKIIGTQEEENKMGRISSFQPVKLILFVQIVHQKKSLLYTLFKNGR